MTGFGSKSIDGEAFHLTENVPEDLSAWCAVTYGLPARG
ncbi:hypothetical protein M2351_003926 [Azospirillum canadense]|nr:hypothetical protein [Azospirillum canadense]